MKEPQIKRIKKYSTNLFYSLRQSFPDISWDQKNLRKYLANPSNILLVATADGICCGMVRAHFLSRYDRSASEILLHEIEVPARFRRQGIATALIKKLKDIGRQAKVREIWVVAGSNNLSALRLYQKTGARAEKGTSKVLVYPFK